MYSLPLFIIGLFGIIPYGIIAQAAGSPPSVIWIFTAIQVFCMLVGVYNLVQTLRDQ